MCLQLWIQATQNYDFKAKIEIELSNIPILLI